MRFEVLEWMKEMQWENGEVAGVEYGSCCVDGKSLAHLTHSVVDLDWMDYERML
jgi:hypothetical protein